ISVFFGYNPLNSSLNSRIMLSGYFPQGWAFFTKNSTDPQLYLYDCNGKIVFLDNRNISAKYGFGASRHNRILNLEFSNIIHLADISSISSFKVRAKVLPKDIPSLI